jgi:triacylglycerol lipase
MIVFEILFKYIYKMKFIFILFLLLQIRAFNINNILFHAKLCRFTYNNKNNEFIIIHKNKTIDICFRGTKNINDIFLNFDIFPQQFLKKDILVHRGFLYKYFLFRNLLLNKTNEILLNNNITEIYISGHSSGGAIANIASLDLYYLYPNLQIKTITFGSPRLANKAFINEYNKKISNSIRIVNKCDIIQYLPLPIIYQHIHEPYILDCKNKINLINNHKITTYIRNLKFIIFNIR